MLIRMFFFRKEMYKTLSLLTAIAIYRWIECVINWTSVSVIPRWLLTKHLSICLWAFYDGITAQRHRTLIGFSVYDLLALWFREERSLSPKTELRWVKVIWWSSWLGILLCVNNILFYEWLSEQRVVRSLEMITSFLIIVNIRFKYVITLKSWWRFPNKSNTTVSFFLNFFPDLTKNGWFCYDKINLRFKSYHEKIKITETSII